MRLETRVLLLVLVLGLLTGLLPGAEGQYQDDGGRNPYPPTGSDDGGGGGGGHRRVHRAGRARRSEGQPTASVITDMNTNEETTTPAEDRLKCETDDHCSPFTNSVCNVTTKVCECPSTLTVYIPTNKFCGAPALLNTTCEYTQQCTENDKHALCENRQCVCSKDFEFRYFQSNYLKCATQGSPTGPKMEPAMIGVLAGMALMFVIICVVLRLFSKTSGQFSLSHLQCTRHRSSQRPLSTRVSHLSPIRRPQVSKSFKRLQGQRDDCCHRNGGLSLSQSLLQRLFCSIDEVDVVRRVIGS
ncbi:uncharacterized protein LOC143021457 isoform X2 [Oratosquilla oratoria]|uniref:uncharacterized protein LOC143021457 isoform X2 n=1 Tax=Oratosquilla oratoria TaxID=337810 RepID=UPI003F7599E7